MVAAQSEDGFDLTERSEHGTLYRERTLKPISDARMRISFLSLQERKEDTQDS